MTTDLFKNKGTYN